MIIVKSLKSSHRIARFRYSIGSNNITYLHLQIYRNDNFKTYINIQHKKTTLLNMCQMLLYMYLKIKHLQKKLRKI